MLKNVPDDAQLVITPVETDKNIKNFGSNVWPEQFDMANITERHKLLIENGNDIPQWACIKCPACGLQLDKSSVRKIGFCMNARNLKDVFIEYICHKCQTLDTVYFRKAIENKTFSELLQDVNGPETQPMTENEMYQARYNNVMEL